MLKLQAVKKKEIGGIGAKIANFASGSMHAFQHQQSPSIFSYKKNCAPIRKEILDSDFL